jgi:hypothetical protein
MPDGWHFEPALVKSEEAAEHGRQDESGDGGGAAATALRRRWIELSARGVRR